MSTEISTSDSRETEHIRHNFFEHVTKIVRPMKSTAPLVNRASVSFLHSPFALFSKTKHQESLYTEMIDKQEKIK